MSARMHPGFIAGTLELSEHYPTGDEAAFLFRGSKQA